MRSPLTTDLGSFRAQPTLFVSAVLLGAALYAFRNLRRAGSR
jgi:hypothetical protein